MATVAMLLLPSVMITSVSGGDPIVVTSGKTIYVDDSGGKEYTRILDAVDAANPGDTVYVYSGTYNESITITKTINLTGEDKSTTIINGNGHYVLCIYAGYVDNMSRYISADHVNISGFTIKKGGYGIKINSNYNSITNNNINNNGNGIYLQHSSNNVISGNTISNNAEAGMVFFDYSSNNTIAGNTISNNITGGSSKSTKTTKTGICFIRSNNNSIGGFKPGLKNTISNNTVGIQIFESSGYNTWRLLWKNNFENNKINIEGPLLSKLILVLWTIWNIFHPQPDG